MSIKKANSTPEEWAAHLERSRRYYAKDAVKRRAQKREYSGRPEVKAARKNRADTPEAALRRAERAKSAEGRERAKQQYEKVRADPVAWALRIQRQRERRTGMSSADIEAMLLAQGNACAICKRDFEGRQVRADHCHDTGKPRGLLCHHCNIIEGMIRSMDIAPEDFAERLADYLAHPPFLLSGR